LWAILGSNSDLFRVRDDFQAAKCAVARTFGP
jgi:hypothetical protein